MVGAVKTEPALVLRGLPDRLFLFRAPAPVAFSTARAATRESGEMGFGAELDAVMSKLTGPRDEQANGESSNGAPPAMQEISPVKSRSKLTFDNIGFILGLIWIPAFFLLFMRDANGARSGQHPGPAGDVLKTVMALLCAVTFFLIVGGIVTAVLDHFSEDR